MPIGRSEGEKLECPENVLQAAVLSPAGDVSPCVYTNLPTLTGDYYVRGEPHQVLPLWFGNVHDLSFQEIWRQPAYREFRGSWRRGELAGSCRHCLKL